MSNMILIRHLDTQDYEISHKVLRDVEIKDLEKLYVECVKYKKKYKRAYNNILNELNHRTSESIEVIDMEHCAALDQENVAAKKEDNSE